jgi:hypothetical protein
MRLSGWHKIGIVASVCWFLAGMVWINGLVLKEMGVGSCVEVLSPPPNRTLRVDEQCLKKFDAAYPDAWNYTVTFSFIPIPIVWLIVYGLVRLGRRIRAGFALNSSR